MNARAKKNHLLFYRFHASICCSRFSPFETFNGIKSILLLLSCLALGMPFKMLFLRLSLDEIKRRKCRFFFHFHQMIWLCCLYNEMHSISRFYDFKNTSEVSEIKNTLLQQMHWQVLKVSFCYFGLTFTLTKREKMKTRKRAHRMIFFIFIVFNYMLNCILLQ